MLTAERTVLNFLGHLSGVATLTAAFAAAMGSCALGSFNCSSAATPALRAAG